MEPSHQFVSAQGYFELGMTDDAWEHLAKLSEEEQAHPRTLRLRSQLLISTNQFTEALAICRQLRDVAPDDVAGYIHGAYCLHEVGKTEDAREMLLDGPETLREEPIFFYNLGCYEARLGEIDSARAWLQRSFEMDGELRHQARRDPDLTDVWDESQATGSD